MPFSMKLWQVKGKDLQEVSREALDDGQRLEDWVVKATGNRDEFEWIIVHPEPGGAALATINGQQKSAPSPSNSIAFQETKVRAHNGDAAAQAALGFMCELGLDAPVDCAQAVKWYRKAADRGNARAQLNLRQIAALGFMYSRGVAAPADCAEAVKWCRKAAEKGNPRAQFNLGQMYEWGNGVQQDFAEAAAWYRQAAEQGGAAAQFKLGLCYCDGHGVPQNTAEAVKWWVNAARQGEAAAQFKLGVCYCNGQGVPQDYAEAVKWYREAAEQGETMAQGKLGDAYYIGLGVAANYAEAVKWYREAADHGEPAAQRHLGIMYGLGQGVPQDYVQAYKWYTLAAAQNDTNAIHNRNSILNSLTPSQIAEAERLSYEFAARKEGGALNRDDHQNAVVPASLVEGKNVNPSQAAVTARGNTVLGIDVLLVGRRVTTASGGCIDLLAIDGQANLVVLELKRDKTPHELLAQTLDHASWVKGLSYEQIDTITKGFTGKPLWQAFSDHYGVAISETVNASHSMLILTSELDDSSERIVQYLAAQHGVPIHVLFIALFKTAFGEFLGRAHC
jgi:TPR repeat protein